MRRKIAKPLVLLGWTVLASFGWGCTFLISFDEEADGGSAATDDASTPTTRDAGDGSTTTPRDAGDAAVLAEPPCDTNFPLGQVSGCNTFQNNGQACATNSSFTSYPAGYTRSNDIVTCQNTGGVAKAICVRHCAGAGGCASLPNGFPDQCDTCQGRTNGTYCGGDLGFTKDDAPLLVTCTSNKMSARIACDAGCNPKTVGNAACK